MSTTPSGETPGQRSLRWLLAAGSLALFVGLARLFNPAPSTADIQSSQTSGEPPRILAGGERGLASDRQAAPSARSGPVEIGELVGREFTLRVFSTPEGPRYTVIDRDGHALAQLLEADEIYRRFPDLNVRSLQLRGDDASDLIGGPLMLADDPADPTE